MQTTQRLMAGLVLGLALSNPVIADPPEGKGKSEKHQKHEKHSKQSSQGHRGADLVVNLSFTEARRIAVAQRAVGYAALPPGIRKNLARGKPLPPGIAKRGVPGPVLAQLPQYPGYEWQVAGSDLVLIAIATAVVAEVLSGVFD